MNGIADKALDTANKAYNVAVTAQTRIDSHEAHCAERWAQTRDSINGLYKRWWWLLTTIIGGLAAVIAMLAKLVFWAS